MNCFVTVETLGLQPRECSPHWELIAHGDLRLDDGVEHSVRPEIRRDNCFACMELKDSLDPSGFVQLEPRRAPLVMIATPMCPSLLATTAA
jgi:hypothetical protein